MSDSKPYLSENEARQLYIGDDAAHDFDHILRVTRLGAYLAECEGADIEVVRLAALLHDVPANEAVYKAADAGNVRRTHHLAAADFARQLLHARGMENERIVNVAHCIEAHRFRDQSIQPTTLEAQCLYDADKLDSIGAIGVARAFAYAGHEGNRLWTEPWIIVSQQMAKPTGADYTPVHEFVYKLQRLLATLHTATAQRIGAERHAFMVTFFSQLDAEMNFF